MGYAVGQGYTRRPELVNAASRHVPYCSRFQWKTFAPEYQVVVEVTHFLGQTGGEVSLIALWSILNKDGREALVSKKSSFRESTGSSEYEALAAAMSRTVAALSRDIATALLALPQ